MCRLKLTLHIIAITILILTGISTTFAFSASNKEPAKQVNGFLLNLATIPADDILQGGPPRDGIPALHHPRFLSHDDRLNSPVMIDDNAIVLGISHGNTSKAYPISIMNWHEIVNDNINERPIVISYCPLCGSGIAFYRDRTLSDNHHSNSSETLTFGVSGLLYQSDMLMYDHQTESLWSQIKGTAVTGAQSGQQLEQIPMQLTRWKHWLARHPNTQLLSRETGYNRDYDRNPYEGYTQHDRLYFPINTRITQDYGVKEWVFGLNLDGVYVAISSQELDDINLPRVQIALNQRIYTLTWDTEAGTLQVFNSEMKEIPVTPLYWFAWQTFHPDTLRLNDLTMLAQ